MKRAVVAAVAVFLAWPGSAAADWPVFGHDLGNSRNAATDGPTRAEVASMHQAWTFNSSRGDFTGTPVVAAGTLVAGTNLGEVFALEAATGKVLWSRDAGAPINGSAAIDLNAPGGPIALIPVAALDAPRLVALSLATGAMRWQTVLTRQPGADVYGSPVFWRGSVYIGTGGPGNDESNARGSVVALDEATGHIKWQTFTVPPGHDGGGVWCTPTIDPTSGRLYVGTGNAYHDPAADTTDSMMVLSASTGRIVAHFQSVAGDVWELNAPANGPDYDFGASANLFTDSHGRRLVGEGQKSGIYWALDPATMKPVWRRSVGPGSQADGGIGSTAEDGTTIYGSDSIDSQVFALERDGTVRWSSFDTGTLHVSPVALGNGVLYSTDSTAGLLTARDATTGAVVAKLPLGAPTFGGISLVGHAVFVAVGTGPPSPVLPLPASSTSGSDGNGSIVAFGDTSTAGPGGDQFDLHFTSPSPGTSTAARLRASVHRSSPDAKPSPLRSEVLDLPPGARFDGAAVPACHASDSELQQQGPSACPAASEVGAGTIQFAMGSPLDPETADITAFNWGRGTVEVVTVPGTGATLAIDRGNFTGPGELTNHPPRAPGGPPDFETSVSSIDLTYRDTRAQGGRAFITTPPSCPAAGVWTSMIAYSTADGRSYRATSHTPCTTPPQRRRHAAGRMRVAVTPGRVRQAREIRLRVRVASPVKACVRGVVVRLGRTRALTDVHGRALLLLWRLPVGRYRVAASKRGCTSTSVRLVVIRGQAAKEPRGAGRTEDPAHSP